MVDVVLGLQWGDEGKGKIVDYLASNYDIVARFQGGPNAGHTLYVDDNKIVLHQIPSGILHDNISNLIGSGVVLDPITLQKEIQLLSKYTDCKNLYISERTSLILPTHRLLDKASELHKGNTSIGSTLKGISPAYMDVTGRNALRVGDILRNDFFDKYVALKSKHEEILSRYELEWDFFDKLEAEEALFFASIEALKNMPIINAEYWLNERIRMGERVLAEGAQGSMLDITFGTYPYVTSSHTLSGGVCTGLGISPKLIDKIYGVTKAYCTRVGNGPFPTELNDSVGEKLRAIGNEFGATTGRPRGCGWLDLVALKYACMLNGVTHLIVTKMDVLDSFRSIDVCYEYEQNNTKTSNFPFEYTNDISPVYTSFPGWWRETQEIRNKDELPGQLIDYLTSISLGTNTPVSHVSNGPNRNQIVKI